MASSYTPILRLTLPTTGELTGTWGSTVNTGVTSLLEASVSGTASITMVDADYTLSTANGVTDEARNMFVTLTGTLTAAKNVICPAVSKLYSVYNNTSGGYAITFKTSAGTGISVPNGARMVLRCDGTNVVVTTSYLANVTFASPIGLVKGDVGLGNVDNTSDANKPISTATQNALNLKADLVSPALTGTPTAPTAAPGTNTTQIATTAFIVTSFAPLNSPALTGTPTAPTATPGTNSTQVATTAFVATSFAPLASPALTGTPTAPTAATGASTTQIATTAFVAATAFSAALPGQTGNANKVVTTDGSTASWTALKTISGETVLGSGNIEIITPSLLLMAQGVI